MKDKKNITDEQFILLQQLYQDKCGNLKSFYPRDSKSKKQSRSAFLPIITAKQQFLYLPNDQRL